MQPTRPGTGLETLVSRMARGRRRREQFPRREGGRLDPEAPDRDIVPILERDNAGRIADLVPSRYARMLESPFAFFRGSLSVMMADVGPLPHSGITPRLCGDCHLGNFGGLVTPDRRLLFGINDFDHAGVGPFEWDLKRLATSFAVVSALRSSRESSQPRVATGVARAYGESINAFSRMSVIDTWNSSTDAGPSLLHGLGKQSARQLERDIREAASRTQRQRFAKAARVVDGRPEFRQPNAPEASLPGVRKFESDIAGFLEHYIASLPVERRLLVERYRLFDVKTKLTGIGSFGLRSALALLMAGTGDPVFLQLKQAGRSALEPHAGASATRNDALRVIVGQHTMQASSDVFLGWFRSQEVRANFYVRRHDESRLSVDFEKARSCAPGGRGLLRADSGLGRSLSLAAGDATAGAASARISAAARRSARSGPAACPFR